MNALRRTLYLQAAVWSLGGLALTLVPHLVVASLFGPPFPLPRELILCSRVYPGNAFTGPAWFRLLGIQMFGLAMVMVLVAHRIERLWWWAWGFAFTTVATAAVVILHAAFGRTICESAVWWWLFAAVTFGFSVALLFGLFVSSRENPDLIGTPD